jgi:5-methylcytosine-specific restriction enzyme A
VGYWASYYLRVVRRHGGLEAARRMLRTAPGGGVQKGLQALIDAGYAHEISMEALVLRRRFAPLFTKEERAEARRRLRGLPTHTKRRRVRPSNLFPELARAGVPYREGAVMRVLVNAHERNSAARKACIARHGCRYAVCDLSFESRYGAIGRDFIHVHHRKPLAGVRAEYTVDPVRDLVPVCPNCHAMLHTEEPPMSIEDLKVHLARAAK